MAKRLDIFKCYQRSLFPEDPASITKQVLSYKDDKGLLELFCFFIALNADKIDVSKIYKRLDTSLKPIFKDLYNKAFLLLKVWSILVEISLGKRLTLPNLFLAKNSEANPYHVYKTIFGKDVKRIEKRWKEILNLCTAERI